MVAFGQLVVGPSGAGKTTFCAGMEQLLSAIGRKALVVNLDFANDGPLPFENFVDVRSLARVEEAMAEFGLGPNGALVYCMEYLRENIDWLEGQLRPFCHAERSYYLVFDCPGQVELYTHNEALREAVAVLVKKLDLRLTSVHCVDSVLCAEPSKFISALLLSLSGQIMLEMPHVNLLTKIDLLRQQEKDLPFKLSYYLDARELRQLLEALRSAAATPEHPFDRRFRRLNEELCALVEDFNLVGFLPVAVEDKGPMLDALRQIDTANGYVMSAFREKDPAGFFKITVRNQLEMTESVFCELEEKYLEPGEDREGEPDGEGERSDGVD